MTFIVYPFLSNKAMRSSDPVAAQARIEHEEMVERIARNKRDLEARTKCANNSARDLVDEVLKRGRKRGWN